MPKTDQFLTGAEVAVQAAMDAGAGAMYGYPITPTTEIFSGWIKRGNKYLQTEDEIAAGFAICGAVLAGQKAFTATAGPGHILMQDSLSMAEGMRLPFVTIVGQRGGPSSGTVIYSQQEVFLACFGGNGEGFRIVYSPSGLEELYSLTRKAFNSAWKYRFPAFVLTDGYTLKMRGIVNLENTTKNIDAYPLVPEGKNVHLPNIYTFEEDLNKVIKDAQADFNKFAKEIVESAEYQTKDAEILLIAHGIVAASATEAIDEARKKGIKVGMFRPITLRPFDAKKLNSIAGQKKLKKIAVIESSAGQLERLVKENMDPENILSIRGVQFPALGIETQDIINFINNVSS